MPPDQAVAQVRKALAAQPGAGVVVVRWRLEGPMNGLHIQVDQGTSMTLGDSARQRLSTIVEQVIRQTLYPRPQLVPK